MYFIEIKQLTENIKYFFAVTMKTNKNKLFWANKIILLLFQQKCSHCGKYLHNFLENLYLILHIFRKIKQMQITAV